MYTLWGQIPSEDTGCFIAALALVCAITCPILWCDWWGIVLIAVSFAVAGAVVFALITLSVLLLLEKL